MDVLFMNIYFIIPSLIYTAVFSPGGARCDVVYIVIKEKCPIVFETRAPRDLHPFTSLVLTRLDIHRFYSTEALIYIYVLSSYVSTIMLFE